MVSNFLGERDLKKIILATLKYDFKSLLVKIRFF